MQKIGATLDEYISGAITGRDLVNAIDRFVADEMPDDVPAPVAKLVDKFQDELALYVADPIVRAEHPSYFGPETLLDKTREFIPIFRTTVESGGE